MTDDTDKALRAEANAAAFPVVPPSEPGYPYPSEGMRMIDYFAARAPVDIPHWFKHGEVGTKPAFPEIFELAISPQRKERLAIWRMAPERAIDDDDPPEERAFKESYKTACNLLEVYERMNLVARYFEWRWFYARQMVRYGLEHGLWETTGN